ncbi:uncharacterized protein LOC125651202 [Ostrea edulis]|uniref:uncharacterized protein LOC125651202 n=1 Tax=Ostrea edulis TaxID=37623 RepID=UPI0024AF18FD|nr:uncharacterized protein LOC125651202 [Ostrea edulis]
MILWEKKTFTICIIFTLFVATLHFNENDRRHQATTTTGAVRWHLSYPKRSKGEVAVLKPDKTPITYDYVEILRINLVERRLQFPTCPAATAEANRDIGYRPPSLTSSFACFSKDGLIATRRTRFARDNLVAVEGPRT